MYACVCVCLSQSLGRMPDVSFPLLVERGACNICMHSVTRGLSTEHCMPLASQAESKCPFPFRLSTVAENVLTINHIDFLKSYCCFCSFSVTFYHFKQPFPSPQAPLFLAFCIKQNCVFISLNVRFFPFLTGLTQLAP